MFVADAQMLNLTFESRSTGASDTGIMFSQYGRRTGCHIHLCTSHLPSPSLPLNTKMRTKS